MTTKITAQVRNTIHAIVADSAKFDANTVRINRDGYVTAEEDYDKTFNAPRVGGLPATRSTVGHIDELIDADGQRREGW